MIDSTQLDTQQQALLTHIKGWSPARFNYRPSPAAWSVVVLMRKSAVRRFYPWIASELP